MAESAGERRLRRREMGDDGWRAVLAGAGGERRVRITGVFPSGARYSISQPEDAMPSNADNLVTHLWRWAETCPLGDRNDNGTMKHVGYSVAGQAVQIAF